MSENVVDYLLTDEFVEYSIKIASIHNLKKQKSEVIKAAIAKFKEESAELDAAAVVANNDFEEWKSQRVKR